MNTDLIISFLVLSILITFGVHVPLEVYGRKNMDLETQKWTGHTAEDIKRSIITLIILITMVTIGIIYKVAKSGYEIPLLIFWILGLVVPLVGSFCAWIVIDNTQIIRLDSGKKDKRGKHIYPGDVLENENGVQFEVRFGKYAMYCPVDQCMMENVGFYVVAEGFYEDMPLGPTEEYAKKIGNVYDNPELKVSNKYRCQAELNI